MATVTMSAAGFLPGSFVTGDTLNTSAATGMEVILNQSCTFGGLVTHAGGVVLRPANGNIAVVLPNATFAGTVTVKGGPRSVEWNASGNQSALGTGGV